MFSQHNSELGKLSRIVWGICELLQNQLNANPVDYAMCQISELSVIYLS